MEIVVHRMTTAEPGLSGTVLCVKQLVVKVLNLSPLNYCNFHLYYAVTVTLNCHNGLFLLFSTCIEWSLKADHSSKTDNR